MKAPIIILHGDDEKIVFQVRSTSDSDETYMVTWDIDNSWLCDCRGCLLGRHLCKHILACVDYMRFMNMALLDDQQVFKSEGGLVGSD